MNDYINIGHHTRAITEKLMPQNQLAISTLVGCPPVEDGAFYLRSQVNGNIARRKASDEQLLLEYRRTKSIWDVAKKYGMCGQSVHERLQKLGVKMEGGGRSWTKADEKIIIEKYAIYKLTGELNKLAEIMGRTKFFICKKAKELGLTNKNRPAMWVAIWKYMDELTARQLMDKFRESNLRQVAFCKKFGLSDSNGLARTMRKFFPDEWELTVEAKQPKQTLYRFGRSFEYQCKNHLMSFKYFVLRSPASRSPIDLVAIRKGEVLFIQCKRHGVLNPAEWDELYNLASSVGAIPILASKPDARGIRYERMIGLKGTGRKPQPKEHWNPVVIANA